MGCGASSSSEHAPPHLGGGGEGRGAPPLPPLVAHDPESLFSRFQDGNDRMGVGELASMAEALGLIPLGSNSDQVGRDILSELGQGPRVGLEAFASGFGPAVRSRMDSSGIDYPTAALLREHIHVELATRGCLWAQGEAHVRAGITERAVSLDAVSALAAALDSVGPYGLPTLMQAVRTLCMHHTTGHPCRMAELLSPRHVGRPRAFISHMWTSPTGVFPGERPFLYATQQVLEGIGFGAMAEGERVASKLWLDIFAVSQHSGGALQQEDFEGMHDTEKVAGERDGTLLVLDPKGTTLTRAWCLYEVWQTAEQCGPGKLRIVSRDIDGPSLKEVFVTLDVRKAKATVEADRVMLLERFDASGTPVSELNERIKEALVESARLEAAPLMEVETVEAADVLDKLGTMLQHCMARYAEAEPLYLRALGIREKALGADHPGVGYSCYNLANLYKDQGKYAEAEPLYLRTLGISEKAKGADHPDVGSSCNNLAGLYVDQGKYAEAEPLYLRALDISEKAQGVDHPDVGSSCNNLAILYSGQGKYAEAEPLYLRALGISEKALGADHPDVGLSCNNLALFYLGQGKYAEAEPLYLRALGIREKALGADHPAVGSSCNNLAGLYQTQGKYAEAEPLYLRALGISEKAQGVDHPDFGQWCNNLAALYQNQGKYAEAEPLYLRALSISEKALGADHPLVGSSCNNLANLYEGQGKYAEAEPLYLRALGIREKAMGADHPHVESSCQSLANLFAGQGKYAKAEPLYLRALGIREKALGADHPHVGLSCHGLGIMYGNQGKYAEAESLFLRAQAESLFLGAGGGPSARRVLVQQPSRVLRGDGPGGRGGATARQGAADRGDGALNWLSVTMEDMEKV